MNLITFKNPKSRVSEAFRTLRTNIQFSGAEDDIKSLLITSVGPAEGKTTTISNLAVTMAQSGKRVLLIDADLRKPSVAKVFALPKGNGLTNILVQNKKAEECIVKTEIENLYILQSGPIPPNPAELLQSNRMKTLLDELKLVFDIILLDAPPVIAVSDAQILSTLVNGVVFVFAYKKTPKNLIVKAKESIDKVGGKVIGTVLNKVPEKDASYYGGKYYYNYYGSNEK